MIKILQYSLLKHMGSQFMFKSGVVKSCQLWVLPMIWMLTQGVVLGQKQTDPTVPPPGYNLVIEGTLLQQWRVEGDPEFRDFPPGYQQRVFIFTNTIHPDGWSLRFTDSMVEGSRISWVMKSGVYYSLNDFWFLAISSGKGGA